MRLSAVNPCISIRKRLVICNIIQRLLWVSPKLTFYLRVAERAISEAMRVNRFYIEQWIKSGEKRRLVIQLTVGGYKVGGYIAKGTSNYVQTSKLRVVLDPKSYNGKQYYILTAYPIG